LHSKEIAKLINDTLRLKHDVWVITDLHLWRKDAKGSTSCHKRSDFESVINEYKKTVKPEDLVINLGDLVDGELNDQKAFDELKEIFKSLPGTKVLVRGNNDLKDASFYKACGFKYVVQAFVWSNVLFTHMPIENAFDLNIHGHIHGYKRYWVPYTNQIDAAAYDGRNKPVDLLKLLRSQPIYAKSIKEEPEHFNESASVFDIELIGHEVDPFPDEEE
jgi:calcineurin-like phosphoesterase family protein